MPPWLKPRCIHPPQPATPISDLHFPSRIEFEGKLGIFAARSFYRPSPRPFHFWRAFLLRCFGAKLGPHCHFYPKSRVWAPLEPGFARDGGFARRRCGNFITPQTVALGIACNRIPGSLSMRRHARLQRSGIPPHLLPHRIRRVLMDMRARLRRSRCSGRRGRGSRSRLGRHLRS